MHLEAWQTLLPQYSDTSTPVEPRMLTKRQHARLSNMPRAIRSQAIARAARRRNRARRRYS